MTRNVELNAEPIQYLGSISPIDYHDLNIINCKNASLKEALSFYRDTPVVNAIEHMATFLNPKYKFQLVDIKLHVLTKGDIPCIPGWHIDGGPDIESEYLLCVAGVSLTDFCSTKISLPYNKSTRIFCDDLNNSLGNNAVAAKDWQIVKYNNLTPHRGTPALKDGRRLLIRVMGNNNISPQPIRDWKPTIVKSGVKNGI